MSRDPDFSVDADVEWIDDEIEGCVVRSLKRFSDDRGWLSEFFRRDELSPELLPAMGYISLTHPGVARGPHEHEEQTDLFVFFNGRFRLFMWDIRKNSPSYRNRRIVELGEENPAVVIIPPGVVHAYRNVGDADALIVNCPNALYAGEGKRSPVDEIRHEDQPNSPFRM